MLQDITDQGKGRALPTCILTVTELPFADHMLQQQVPPKQYAESSTGTEKDDIGTVPECTLGQVISRHQTVWYLKI